MGGMMKNYSRGSDFNDFAGILGSNANPFQSEEGKGLGPWICISLSQQLGFPSPILVQSTSVPHVSQRYLFPS
jgi:hypothetical protein